VSASARSRVQLLGSAAFFSTGGAAIKACALSNWQVMSLRAAIAAATVLLLLPAARRRWTGPALVVGVLYAATAFFFVTSNKLTTGANTIFLQSSSPLYIALLSPWLLHERVKRRDVLFMAALAAGLVLIFLGTQAPVATAPDPVRGNVLGALSGLSCGLMLIGLRWLERAAPGSSATAVVVGNTAAFLLGALHAFPVEARAVDWLILSYLGIFQIGVGYVLLLSALRHVGALEATLLLFIEPVLNPLWTWLVHGERPGAWSLAGGALILAATAVKTWSDLASPVPASARVSRSPVPATAERAGEREDHPPGSSSG
jgi:drug/metabolite transporter (DMT)-like permease